MGSLALFVATSHSAELEQLFLVGPRTIPEQVRYVATGSAEKFAIVSVRVTKAANCWESKGTTYCIFKARPTEWLLERKINEDPRPANNEYSVGFSYSTKSPGIGTAEGRDLIVFLAPAKTAKELGHFAATAIVLATPKNSRAVKNAIKDFLQ